MVEAIDPIGPISLKLGQVKEVKEVSSKGVVLADYYFFSQKKSPNFLLLTEMVSRYLISSKVGEMNPLKNNLD